MLKAVLVIALASQTSKGFLFTTRTTTITSFTSTTTNTVSVTPSCYTTVDPMAPATISACAVRRRRRRAEVIAEEPTVIVDGRYVHWGDLIRPSRVEDDIEDALETSENRRARFNPITYLDKTTTSLVFTAATTTTIANTATITFDACTPTDVSSLIGPAC